MLQVVGRLIQFFLASPDETKVNTRTLRKETITILNWPSRSGALLAIKECAGKIGDPVHLSEVVQFLLEQGLTDANAEVWDNAVAAGLEVRGCLICCLFFLHPASLF